ncbi:MAG: hypothetical protein VXZ43_09445 [Pseudomonadota bacterium]|jgi:hypothetical protein|uniref:hypothetical protein n=1 Tax=Brevundimonas aurantiaca TaxID=74316 RepID=UPI00174BFB6B|nr:hypothetical protein [Brevundimonas aurantiaca]MEC8457121.1 hypothetical protein [Pseudomonadota bacterium]
MTHQEPQPNNDRLVDRQGVDARSARQGRSGNRILLILIASLGGAALLLGLLWMFSQGGLSQTNANDGDQAVDARAFSGDAATPPAADAPTGPNGEPQPVPTGEAANVNAPTQPSS